MLQLTIRRALDYQHGGTNEPQWAGRNRLLVALLPLPTDLQPRSHRVARHCDERDELGYEHSLLRSPWRVHLHQDA